MLRYIALTIAAVLLAGGTAAAQVAAPSFNPTPTISFAPGNPAVLPWDGPSRIGAAYGQLTQDQPGAPVSPAADGSVTTLAAQWSGPTFSAAAGIFSFDVTQNPALGTNTFSIDAQVLVVAAQFAGMYAVGLTYEKVNEAGGGNDETETTPLLGATVRLGEVFYLGVAAGTATREDNTSPPDELKRSVLNYGIAYHWREKDRGLHLEYFHGNREGVIDPVSLYSVDEDDTAGFTVEAIFSNFLIGYQSQSTDNTDPLGVAQGSADITIISLGYVPAPGWSIVASKISRDSLDTAGVVQDSTDVTSLGVALRF